MNKRILFLFIAVTFIIVLFVMNVFVKTKIPAAISSKPGPVQLKRQLPAEDSRAKNKKILETPKEKVKYEFPLRKDEPLLN